MNDLSFTQEYLLCALSPKGTIPTMKSTEITACLVASGLLELLYFHIISFNGKKKIMIEKDLEPIQFHLEPLYNTIRNSKTMDIKDIATKYVFGSGKLVKNFVQALSLSMVKRNFVSTETGGLFHNKTLFIPNNDEVLKIVEKIRAEFLEKGTVEDETVILGALLQRSGLLKNYFSKYESERLKERLQEIKKSEAGSFINETVDYIDTLLAIIVSVGGSAGA